MSPAPSPATLTQLRNALERVYRAFDQPVPKAIEGCPCCIRRGRVVWRRAGRNALGKLLPRLAEPTSAPVLEELRRRHPRSLSPYWEDTPSGLEEMASFLKQH